MSNLSANLVTCVAVLLLCGCDERGYIAPMSNDEIIAETKKCTDAGLRAVPMAALWDGVTRRIVCQP